MKKIIALILIILTLSSLSACKKEPQTQNEKEDKVIFRAVVIEVHESSIIVEPLEGYSEKQSANLIFVSLKDLNLSTSPQVGDTVEIEHDGYIREIYPAELSKVYSVIILK